MFETYDNNIKQAADRLTLHQPNRSEIASAVNMSHSIKAYLVAAISRYNMILASHLCMRCITEKHKNSLQFMNKYLLVLMDLAKGIMVVR